MTRVCILEITGLLLVLKAIFDSISRIAVMDVVPFLNFSLETAAETVAG